MVRVDSESAPATARESAGGTPRDRMRRLFRTVVESDPISYSGRVTRVVGLTVESQGPGVRLGELCHVLAPDAPRPLPAEVVGFRDDRVLLMPLGDIGGIGPGCEVVATGESLSVGVGPQLLGRVLDGLGNPIDGRGELRVDGVYPVHNEPPPPMSRRRITQPIGVGVRAIDALLTCGRGQRMGIFSGSGVGKSTLLGMVARNTDAEVIVVGLVGERGREVREFIEKDLGPSGLARSVVVVATSDRPALVRIKAAYVATAIAEYFRDQGKDVLLMMDSVTRFAMAQREVGLAVGEPPATRGYTPSVFAQLPRLLERAGTSDRGTITGFYTVLVDADDINEPVTDTVRGILDGHVVLSRAMAAQNHWPAIDVLGSISRVMVDITAPEHLRSAAVLRSALATYKDIEDLVNIGAYVPGQNRAADYARDHIDIIRGFLRQGIHERAAIGDTIRRLEGLLPDPDKYPGSSAKDAGRGPAESRVA
jgi:flagellum-specific ATP synthase